MSRILVAGATGMLGTDLVRALHQHSVTAAGSADLDITDRDAVDAAVTGYDYVVNCAAYTRVDDAETHEDSAYALNAIGAESLARASARAGATFIHISTDYVFDGRASEPYGEDEPVAPISAYGRTKASGERLALAANPQTIIVRTAWIYGAHGGNFPKTMLRLANERDNVQVVTDQIGQPTWTADVCRQIVALIEAGLTSGIFHATSQGTASWFEFAQAVFAEAGLDSERVQPTDSTSFVMPASRPAWSVLGHDSWERHGLPKIRPWREALHAAFSAGVLSER